MAVENGVGERSLSDISNAISVQFNVPASALAVIHVAGLIQRSVNENPQLLSGDIANSEAFKQLVISSPGSAELTALLDPAKQAQLKREQAEKANITDANAIGGYFSNGQWIPYGARIADANNGGGGTGSVGSSVKYNGLPGSIGDPAFAASVGISSSTIGTLASMGFTRPEQIRALVHDAGSLGVDKNLGSVALGNIKRYDPSQYKPDMEFFKRHKHNLEEMRRLQKEIDTEPDQAKKAEKQKHLDEMKKREEQEKEKRRMQHKTPQGRKGFDNMNRLLEQNSHLAPNATDEQVAKKRQDTGVALNLDDHEARTVAGGDLKTHKKADSDLLASAGLVSPTAPNAPGDPPKTQLTDNSSPAPTPTPAAEPTKPVQEAKADPPKQPPAAKAKPKALSMTA